MVKQSIKKT